MVGKMRLNRNIFLCWTVLALGAEGPVDVILKLLRAIAEILKSLRSL